MAGPDGGQAVRFPAYTGALRRRRRSWSRPTGRRRVDAGRRRLRVRGHVPARRGVLGQRGGQRRQPGPARQLRAAPGSSRSSSTTACRSCRSRGRGEVFVEAAGRRRPRRLVHRHLRARGSEVEPHRRRRTAAPDAGPGGRPVRPARRRLQRLPLTVGGKTGPDGTPVASADQFNGEVDDVFLHRLRPPCRLTRTAGRQCRLVHSRAERSPGSPTVRQGGRMRLPRRRSSLRPAACSSSPTRGPVRADTVPAPARDGVWPLSPASAGRRGLRPAGDDVGSRTPGSRPARAGRPARAHLPRRDGHLRRAAGRPGGRGRGPRRGADDVRTGGRERATSATRSVAARGRHAPAHLEPLLSADLPALGTAAWRLLPEPADAGGRRTGTAAAALRPGRCPASAPPGRRASEQRPATCRNACGDLRPADGPGGRPGAVGRW